MVELLAVELDDCLVELRVACSVAALVGTRAAEKVAGRVVHSAVH